MKKRYTMVRMGGMLLLGATLAMGGVLTACSDDDEALSAITSPSGSDAIEVTSTSLTFVWSKVSGVIQFGLTLKDAADTVVATDVTTAQKATFTGLTPGETYTLEVVALTAIGSDYANSNPTILTGTTLSYLDLETPVLIASPAARTVISWAAVSGATQYAYSYVKDGATVTGTTEDTQFTIDFLPVDEAVTVSVVAQNPGDDLYGDSQTATIEVTRTRSLSQTISASLTDGYSYSYEKIGERKLQVYSDGSYVIPAWYGTEGYDFEFIVPDASTGAIIPSTDYVYDSGYYDVPASASSDIWIYVDGGYGAMYGDTDQGGLYFWDSTGYGYYTLEWAPQTTWAGSWTMPDGTVVDNLTMEKLADGSYVIYGWYGNAGYDFKFTVDDNGYIVLSEDDYYFDSSYWCYWVPTGPTDDDGAWVYVAGGYGQKDNTGVWFYDYKSSSYYWFKYAE